MKHLRLEEYICHLCNSPFRTDKNPSWGLYWSSKGKLRWKDLATGEGGDQISFLAQYLHIDEHANFHMLVELLEVIADERSDEVSDDNDGSYGQRLAGINTAPELPDKTGFHSGTSAQIKALSNLRSISVTGLEWAQQRGVLVFGEKSGSEVYGVTDSKGWIIEIRRLDGQDFPPYGTLKARKSHAIWNSDKSWPIGIEEAQRYPCIALVEGLPDLLAAHDFILREQAVDGNLNRIKCAPVGIMTSTVRISEEALPDFRGKCIRIFPHTDDPGARAAGRWMEQLKSVGASKVSIFDLTAVRKKVEESVKGFKGLKDLNDLLRLIDQEPFKSMPDLKNIMPQAK